MRTRILAVAVGILSVALVAAATVAVLRTRDLRRAEQRVDELQEQVEALRGEIEELERPAPTEQPDGGSGGPLRELLGDGPFGGLGSDVPGLECLTQGMGGGGVGSLFGDGESPPDDPQALVDHIADEVEELRELELSRDVDAELLPPDETAARLTELVLEDYPPEQAETDRRLLATLGVVDPQVDLRETTRELLSSQVAGFYVPETGELVVRTGGDGRGATEQIVLAHEIQHALADQALGLPDVDRLADDSDRQLATLAVLEGDASLLMNLWALRNLSFAEQLGLALDPGLVAAQEELEQAPHFLAEQLTFPYFDGLEFVCQVWLEGGWRAVDALYTDPPRSSVEVLQPTRYRTGGQATEPARLSAPDGWRHRTTDTFGAAQLSWLFEAPGDAADRALSDPLHRATAWTGGTATVWEHGAETLVGLSLVGGAEQAGPSLCASVIAWYGAAFPDADRDGDRPAARFDGREQDAAVVCEGDQVRVGIGPDLTVAEAVAG